MTQQALYRKWRSRSFDELVGQRHVAQTLRNALESGRVAHAYLFSGPRGTGKTTSARILAKLVNCLAPPEQRPCNECHICRSINDGSALDLIEIDAASNTQVDKVRDVIVEKINYAPSEAKYKFYVIDECFRYEELVTLADGSKLPIGKIVEEKLEVEVLSYNEQTRTIEPKPVVRHMRKQPELPVVRISFDNNRALVCTINHKIYTPDGMMRAGELDVGQFVFANYETITQFQHEVVVGVAIGDGYLGLTGSKMRARLSITHGVAQKEYLDYKKQLLGNLVQSEPVYQYEPRSYSKVGTYRFSSLSRPQIAVLHRELYDSAGNKQITESYLERFTPLGLALWYLDDGSLTTQANYYTRRDSSIANYPTTRSSLSVYQFSPEEVTLTVRWLQDRWGIEARMSNTAKGPSIWMTLAGTRRLHEIIAPYVPPSMEYKLLPEYRGLFEQPLDSGTPGGLAVSVVRKVERVPSPDFVYNIEVADNHNYFARDILVANCHMLSNSAFNALLKTIEEPPPHAMFVLATTEIHKIPATILSRCQRLDFHRISIEEMVAHLAWVVEQEGVTADEEVFDLVARQATGSMRDALSLLDQLLAYGGEHLTLAQARAALGLAATEAIQVLIDYLLAQDVGGALQLVNRLIDQGTDPRQFLVDVLEQMRALLLTLAGGEQRLLNLPDEQMGHLRAQARHVTPPALIEIIRLFNQAGADLKLGLQPQLPLELAIIEAVLTLQRHGVTPAAPPAPLPDRAETPPAPKSRKPAETPPPTPRRKQVKERAAVLEESAPPPAPTEPPLLVEREAEPVEEPEPERLEAEPSLASSEHDLTWWRQQWEPFKEFLASQGEEGKRSALRLKFCEPHALEGQTLTLGFFYSLHLEKIQKREERLVVEQALSAFRGAPISLHCELVPKAQPLQPGKTKYEEAAEDPVIREANKQGGRIVEVYLPDQP